MGKKNELIKVVPKKKSKGKTVVKVIVAIAAINGALKLYSMYKENKENESGKNAGNEVKVYKVYMNGRGIKLDGEKIQGIFIKAVMSGVDLDLRNAIITDDVFITCKSIMSGISIRVPDGVNVELECKNKLSGVANSVPEIFNEEVPTIYIDADSYLSGISVKSASQEGSSYYCNHKSEEEDIFEEEIADEAPEEAIEEAFEEISDEALEEVLEGVPEEVSK